MKEVLKEVKKMTDYIYSKHEGTIEWLEREFGIDAIVFKRVRLKHIDLLKPGDRVFGNASIEIIQKVLDRGAEFYYVAVPGNSWRRNHKGSIPYEYLIKDGAKLIRVKNIELEEVDELEN